jgi:RNA polymerase primary sigma factor
MASRDDEPGGVDSLTRFLVEISRFPLLSREQEVELMRRIERGDAEARELLVNSNLRLVVSIAKRYQGYEVPLLDLIQDGMLGLLRAVDGFDWRRGNKFSTYATWWIRQAVRRGVDNRSRLIRLPTHVSERAQRVARAERSLSAAEAQVDEDAIARVAGVSRRQLRGLREAAIVVDSLDRRCGDADGSALGPSIADDGPDLQEQVEARLAAAAVRDAVEHLPERERRLIEVRFGLVDDDPSSIEAARHRLGISRGEATRLERQALHRLACEPRLRALHEAA